MGYIWNVKQAGFEMSLENSPQKCRGTCLGRLFQTHAAVTGKALSPTVDSRVWLTTSDEDKLEYSRWQALTCATSKSLLMKYEAADPWRPVWNHDKSYDIMLAVTIVKPGEGEKLHQRLDNWSWQQYNETSFCDVRLRPHRDVTVNQGRRL